MTGQVFYKQLMVIASASMAVLGLALVMSYIGFGHTVIEAIYSSHFSIVDQIMEGRRSTPIENYLVAMDKAILRLGVGFMVAALFLALATNPLGLLLAGSSFLMSSLVIFFLLDLFPALVKPLHFDMIPYFNYRLTYVPDQELGFRERPFHKAQISNFRGFGYSPLYGIDVQPRTLHWQTDEEGFRNAGENSVADVVVIGSSFPEYGEDLEDTYPKRLEKKLGGPKILNLAKAGYGPLEYLKVFERYALKKRPKYALFAFNAAGDIDAHLADWVNRRADSGLAKRNIAFGGFFSRYRMALQQTWETLAASCRTVLQLGFNKLVTTESVHPNVAVLSLPNNTTKKIVFLDQHLARSPDELLRSREWLALAALLVEFKRLSEINHIVPLLLYIPGASEIYSPYSTRDSGANWLRVRDSMIASAGSNNEAARRLAKQIGIELISLVPAYKEAARKGKMLYYPLDSHWNADGREIAALVTAQALYAATFSGKQPDHPERDRNLDVGTHHVAVDGRESVMTRTIDGKINFWNRGAEELYGWSQEEAIGKFSHDLLRTRFPKALDSIDAELIQNGQWHGKLVHSTRDGRRVVVDSRWHLDRRGDSEAVVEINTPSGRS